MAFPGVLEGVVGKNDRVLVMRAVGNSCIENLRLAGYTNIYGLDRSKRVYQGKYRMNVRYVYGDPELTHFPSNFFAAVVLNETALEAGDGARLEAQRLVADGGAIVYRESHHEEVAKGSPVALEELDILLCLEGHGGITEYSRVMRQRVEDEWRISANLRSRKEEVSAQNVIVQFENGLPRAEAMITTALELADSGHRVYFDVHSAFSDFGAWNSHLPELEAKTRMLYRANEVAEADDVRTYTLLPHLAYKNVPGLPSTSAKGIRLGSFGFASRGKRHEDLIYMARRLGLPLKLLLSVNTEVSEKVAKDMRDYIASLQRKGGKDVEIVGGFFTYEEIEHSLADCTHLIFTTKSALSNSGSMQLAKRLNRPILSLRSFQAQQAQVYEFDSLMGKSTEIGRQLMFMMAWGRYALRERPDLSAYMLRAFFEREKRGVALESGIRVLIELYRTVTASRKPITRKFIESSVELSRDEDGLDYLYYALRYPEPRAQYTTPPPPMTRLLSRPRTGGIA